jgi:hypothetical protein
MAEQPQLLNVVNLHRDLVPDIPPFKTPQIHILKMSIVDIILCDH